MDAHRRLVRHVDHRPPRPVGSDDHRAGGIAGVAGIQPQLPGEMFASRQQDPIAGPNGLGGDPVESPPGACGRSTVGAVVTAAADVVGALIAEQ